MKLLIGALFLAGGLFFNAGYGSEGRQRRIYWTIDALIWLALFVLMNWVMDPLLP